MQPFALVRPRDIGAALTTAANSQPDSQYIAGGTDLLQLMKEDIARPTRLVDLTLALPDGIAVSAQGAHIGAGATMEQVATHPEMRRHFPVVTQALEESASVQVRNMATMGGNLLQRTRCGYFRDAGVAACNKRRPGSGCSAIGGENRILAVLGTSDHCIATHPSDLAVALVALDAEIILRGASGGRRLKLAELHPLPGDRPDQETQLAPGELIEAIEIPAGPAARRSVYLKVRDRAAFEWALLSAAVGLDIAGGVIREARVAMGGVGTKPWRMPQVETALRGRKPERAAFDSAALKATQGAHGHGGNDFKLTLMPRVLARALELAGETA